MIIIIMIKIMKKIIRLYRKYKNDRKNRNEILMNWNNNMMISIVKFIKLIEMNKDKKKNKNDDKK